MTAVKSLFDRLRPWRFRGSAETGVAARVSTRYAIEPLRARHNPPAPRNPITTIDDGPFAANRAISSAGFPISTQEADLRSENSLALARSRALPAFPALRRTLDATFRTSHGGI